MGVSKDFFKHLFTVSDWKERTEQIQMADFSEECFRSGHHGVVEAGTGVGKSAGYLVPAAIWSVNTGNKVIVSTRTKALQRAFENSQFLSPRGLLTIVAKDHTLRSPNYVRKVKWDGNALINEVVEQKAGRTDWQRVGMSLTSNVKTGWLNPYLCV